MAKVPLRFIQSSPPYNVGEVAGFAPEVALNYVRSGDCVPHTDEAHEALRRLAGSRLTVIDGGADEGDKADEAEAEGQDGGAPEDEDEGDEATEDEAEDEADAVPEDSSDEESEEAEESGDPIEDPWADFPGRAAFERAEISSVDVVAALYAEGGVDALLAIDGIGPATAEAVVAELGGVDDE